MKTFDMECLKGEGKWFLGCISWISNREKKSKNMLELESSLRFSGEQKESK